MASDGVDFGNGGYDTHELAHIERLGIVSVCGGGGPPTGCDAIVANESHPIETQDGSSSAVGACLRCCFDSYEILLLQCRNWFTTNFREDCI